jgi:hypothetical protein
MSFPADKFLGQSLLTKPSIADAALTANRFVKLVSATGPPPHCVHTAEGELGVGVVERAYDSGDIADIVVIGTAWVTAAENITAGQRIASEASGQAEPASSAEEVLGCALTDANSGDPVLVLLGVAGIF